MKTPLLYRYLDTNGDGTGTKNANGNYSGAVEEFYIEAQAGDSIKIARMIVSLEDTAVMQAEEYGNFGSALTNGITIKVLDEDDNVISDLTNGVPIKTNAQWGALCYDVDKKAWGAGDELLLVRWTFTKAGDFWHLEPGQRLVVYLNDDFSGLVNQYFMVQGVT